MDWTAAVVTCAILHGSNHIPPAERAAVAPIEAQAFLDNVRPQLPLELLLGVALVESRFGPMGSARDRDHAVFGIFQIQRLDLRCPGRAEHIVYFTGRRHRRRHVRVVHHDDPASCTEAQTIARAEYFDPNVNIRRGATLLALRRQQVYAARHSARVYASWVGAYYAGSVPPRGHRRALRAFFQYAGRVAGAQHAMHVRLEQCRRETQP